MLLPLFDELVKQENVNSRIFDLQEWIGGDRLAPILRRHAHAHAAGLDPLRNQILQNAAAAGIGQVPVVGVHRTLGQGPASRIAANFDPLRLARLDSLSRLAVAACANVLAERESALPEGAAVVVGSAGATLDRNELYCARLRERGARGVEPRRFPSTSPNLVAGECSILFGLKGPAFTVGAGSSAAMSE